jgi:hypothetical protein
MKPELNTILSRLVASLIVPGFIAVGPYLAVLQNDTNEVHRWLFSGSFGPTAVLVLIVFTAGLLVEEAGSHVEWGYWNGLNFPGEKVAYKQPKKFREMTDEQKQSEAEIKKKKEKDAKEQKEKRKNDWYKYLTATGVSETMEDHIAHIVSRLKWELSGGIAFLVGALPVFCLAWKGDGSFFCPAVAIWVSWWVVFVAQLIVGIGLLAVAKITMNYLVELREKLVKAYEDQTAAGQKLLGQATFENLTLQVSQGKPTA